MVGLQPRVARSFIQILVKRLSTELRLSTQSGPQTHTQLPTTQIQRLLGRFQQMALTQQMELRTQLLAIPVHWYWQETLSLGGTAKQMDWEPHTLLIQRVQTSPSTLFGQITRPIELTTLEMETQVDPRLLPKM